MLFTEIVAFAEIMPSTGYPAGFLSFSVGHLSSVDALDPADYIEFPQSAVLSGRGLDLSFSYSVWVAGMPAYSVGVKYGKKRFSLFAAYSSLSSSLEIFSESGASEGESVYALSKFGLGTALSLGRFSLGFAYVGVGENIDGDSFSSSVFSTGLLYAGKRLKFAAGLNDFSSVGAGGPYFAFSYLSSGGNRFAAGFQAKKSVGKVLSLEVGRTFEASRGKVFVALGKSFFLDYSELPFTHGLSALFVLKMRRFNLGYAFYVKGDLGLTHRVFVSI